MALSNAPTVKRALYDALKASSALTGVGVWHSAPNTDHPPGENLTVGPEDTPMTADQQWIGLGGAGSAPRDETINVPVRVEVFEGGTDEFAAEARAWAIAETVATVLNSRPFDPSIYQPGLPTGFSQATRPFSNGRMARLDFTVEFSGRISGI